MGFALLCCATGTVAQDPATPNQEPQQPRLTQVGLEELSRLEVTTASKRPEEIWRTPAAIYVITQEDIRRSGATSIPEVLRLAPGIEVARIDSNHWAIGVRGFGDQFSKSVLVLIDGRSVYTPLFAGVYWAVQDTLLEDIERIEVIRGPGGTIWGSNAVNGVINIITKKARDSQGVLVSAGGGNVDQGIAGARYGSGNGKGLDYRFYGKGFTRAPQVHVDNSPFDDWRRAQVGFRLDWTRLQDRVQFQGDLYKGEDGQRVSLATFLPPSQGNIDRPVDVSGGNLLVRWQREFSDHSDIEVVAYYDRTRLLAPQLEEIRNTFDVDFTHRFAYARNRIVWGGGARLSPSNVRQTIATLDFVPRNRTNALYSAFVQDEITLVADKLWLTLGSKLEHNNYTGLEVQPSARIAWQLRPEQSLWGSVTRAVRTPSRIDTDFRLNGLVLLNPLIFIQVDGDPTIKSEVMLGLEGGYRTLLGPSFYLDLAVFHNRYDDVIAFGNGFVTSDATPLPPHLTFHVPFENGIKGFATGFEIAPEWKPADWLSLGGSYSFLLLNLRNQTGNTDVAGLARLEGSSPRHQVAIRSLVNLPRGFELDVHYRHVSELPARAVDGYGTADVRLGWRWRRELEFSIVGQNLLQAHHAEFAHDPGPTVEIKRGVFARVTWSTNR